MKAVQRLGRQSLLSGRPLCRHCQNRPFSALKIGLRPLALPSSPVDRFSRRHASTKLRKSIEELPQGLQAPLEPFIEKEASKYSPVIDEVLQNQKRFPKCVLLTRVGQFYEVFNFPLFFLLIIVVFFSSKRNCTVVEHQVSC
jgi:hypothetical protein